MLFRTVSCLSNSPDGVGIPPRVIEARVIVTRGRVAEVATDADILGDAFFVGNIDGRQNAVVAAAVKRGADADAEVQVLLAFGVHLGGDFGGGEEQEGGYDRESFDQFHGL